MKPNYLKQIAALLATWSIAASALAQYVWLDDKGVKQFSDIAPPASVPQNRILKQPHGAASKASNPDTPTESSDDAATDNAKAPPTLADKEIEYKKRKLEQAEKAKKAADEAKRKQDNEENCVRAKSYLDNLKSGARIASTDSKGERSYLSDDDRAREIARAQEAVDSCNK